MSPTSLLHLTQYWFQMGLNNTPVPIRPFGAGDHSPAFSREAMPPDTASIPQGSEATSVVLEKLASHCYQTLCGNYPTFPDFPKTPVIFHKSGKVFRIDRFLQSLVAPLSDLPDQRGTCPGRSRSVTAPSLAVREKSTHPKTFLKRTESP